MPFPHPLPVPTRPLAPLRSASGSGLLTPVRRLAGLRPSPAPGSLRPCGVRVKGAAALGRRSPTRPRRFLAPGGEAFLGSPCRGSLRSAALGRHARPSGLSATSGGDGDHFEASRPEPLPIDPEATAAPSCRERAAHASQTPCKRLWRTFTPSPHSRKGPALKGAQNGLERLRELRRRADSEHAPSFREGRAAAAPRKCDDTHPGNVRVELHRPLGWCSLDPSPPRERNSPDRPPQASGGSPVRPEELTRGDEIPGKPGGFASTRWPGRTGETWSISREP